MKVRAKTSFSGPLISMARGKTAEITDEVILQDLLQAGYVEAAEKEEPKNETKRVNKRRRS
ncbi:MAG TPA: hypothetical protein DEV97_05975 [Lachnospiraceae bacterium]|nr:hypothetical protein [Lachnospiraceae bacterium]